MAVEDKWIRTASDEAAIDEGCWFDASAGLWTCSWIEQHCRLSKGKKFAGKRMILLPWMREYIMPLFSWKRPDGTRRFTESLLFIAKKNAKTTLGAALAAYMLIGDGEAGAEVYTAAGDRAQAALCFTISANMIEQSPALNRVARIFRGMKEIKVAKTRSLFKALSADAPTKHGLDISALFFDELHTQPDRDLFDTLVDGVVSREQPLIQSMTTAGTMIPSLCHETYEYAKRLLDPKSGVADTSFFPVVYETPKEMDWRDPAAWRMANPSFGVTINEQYFHNKIKRVEEVPSTEASFRQLHLNQWVQAAETWLDMEAWDDPEQAKPLDVAALKGRPCYGGLDLSSSQDLTAFSLVFPLDDGRFAVLCWFWIPADNMAVRQRKDRVPYVLWRDQEHIFATPGNVVDHDHVLDQISELGRQFQIKEIAFDRWGAAAIQTALMDRGFELVKFGQGYGSMNGPSKDLERLNLQHRIQHGGNPILRWNADSATIAQNPAGDIKPVKPDRRKSSNRIDGVVAMIMALDRAIRNEAPVPAYSGGRSLVVA